MNLDALIEHVTTTYPGATIRDTDDRRAYVRHVHFNHGGRRSVAIWYRREDSITVQPDPAPHGAEEYVPDQLLCHEAREAALLADAAR